MLVMNDEINFLLGELESLQAWRRDALEAYDATGSCGCWREVCEAQNAIDEVMSRINKVKSLIEGRKL